MKHDPEEGMPDRHHIMDDLLLELQQKISMTENGRSRRMTKQTALLLSLVHAASKGKGRAFDLFWAIYRHYELDAEPDRYLEQRRFSHQVIAMSRKLVEEGKLSRKKFAAVRKILKAYSV